MLSAEEASSFLNKNTSFFISEEDKTALSNTIEERSREGYRTLRIYEHCNCDTCSSEYWLKRAFGECKKQIIWSSTNKNLLFDYKYHTILDLIDLLRKNGYNVSLIDSIGQYNCLLSGRAKNYSRFIKITW
jgi:hypothetical protein